MKLVYLFSVLVSVGSVAQAFSELLKFNDGKILRSRSPGRRSWTNTHSRLLRRGNCVGKTCRDSESRSSSISPMSSSDSSGQDIQGRGRQARPEAPLPPRMRRTGSTSSESSSATGRSPVTARISHPSAERLHPHEGSSRSSSPASIPNSSFSVEPSWLHGFGSPLSDTAVRGRARTRSRSRSRSRTRSLSRTPPRSESPRSPVRESEEDQVVPQSPSEGAKSTSELWRSARGTYRET